LTLFQTKLKVEMSEEYDSVLEFMFGGKDIFLLHHALHCQTATG
jgi:hypothetical protein